MRLEIFIQLDKTPDEVEARYRDSIRRDRHIKAGLKSVSVILFTHEASNAVGTVYGATYMANQERYEMALNLMGWKWNRSFQCPTVHAKHLEAV
jgi:hypothetical protein